MEGGIFMSGKSFGEWLLSAQFAELAFNIFVRVMLISVSIGFMVVTVCGTIWVCKETITWLLSTL